MLIVFSFYQKLKQFSIGLRISILAIFITLFLLSTLSLMTLLYTQFHNLAIYVSLNQMQAASAVAFDSIAGEFKNTEINDRAAADLIQAAILNEGEQGILHYLTNLMRAQTKIISSLRTAYWVSDTGNFILIRREDDGIWLTALVNNVIQPKKISVTYLDRDGRVIANTKKKYLNFNFDPLTRPWYLAAVNEKKTTWSSVYKSRISNFLGTTVSTPVYAPNGKLRGVVSLRTRLDDLRIEVEKVPIGKTGALFIVTQDDKLVAFPHIAQVSLADLLDVAVLDGSFPWVVQAWHNYKKLGRGRFSFHYKGESYLAAFRALPPFGNQRWFIGAVAPESDFTGVVRKLFTASIVFALVILIICVVIVSILVSRVTQSLDKITQEIKRIKQFELDDKIAIRSRVKEISYIAEALSAMKQSLRSFQKYVPSALVRQLIKLGTAAEIGGEKKTLAILFSDVRDFTAISEHMDPDQLAQHICAYFDALSSIIVANRGTIDKYIGDSIMAFWGAPLPESAPCQQAAKTAVECVQRLKMLNAQWRSKGKPELFARFGIHIGDVVVGNLGSSERLNYTVIGDASNTASRLEGINKVYGTQIMVSEAVYQVIKQQYVLRMVDCVTVKGRDEASYIYELIAMNGKQLDYDVAAYNKVFAKGFMAYQQGHWDEAIGYFSECQPIYTEDKVAALFIQRCENFKVKPPSVDWHGVWHLHEK